MIGLDTNVLLRYLARDDPAQTPRADTAIESLREARPGFVNHIVLCELAWSLGRLYGYRRTEIAAAIRGILSARPLRVQAPQLVELALDRYVAGGADFPDSLIGVVNAAVGCSTTYTFDRVAARLPEFSPVE